MTNGAHWPTKENRDNFDNFCIFPVHGKNGLRWPQMGPGGFFPTNPDLANILGRMDLNFDMFIYIFFCFTPDFWISRSPDLQIPRFPGPHISKFNMRASEARYGCPPMQCPIIELVSSAPGTICVSLCRFACTRGK